MKRILKFISSKYFMIPISIIIQFLMVFGSAHFLDEYSTFVNAFNRTVSVLLAIYIAYKPDNPAYRITWIMLILMAPYFGTLMYFLFGNKKVPKELRERDEKLQQTLEFYTSKEEQLIDDLKENDANAYKQSCYIASSSSFPLYSHTRSKYFKLGEEQFEEMLKQLKSAQKFIFLEFFIIKQGIMWSQIVEVLEQKAKEGVDVRLMFDDFGCYAAFDEDFIEQLAKKGIKAKAFNPIRPRLAIQMNNRDHRKIMVVDGKVAMTGGINLADEYINKQVRFGHWKDCGCMIEGEAVWSFTLMFLQFWNYDESEETKDCYEDFYVKEEDFSYIENDGYVQPFADAPTDNENVGENVHINMINNASKYVYITTPYLVIDQEMKTSLILAAKNGVDVRILVPHIPDKRYVFELTRHFYAELIKGGVRVYEYTPGFVHAKTFVADDKYAVVGTTNMDYRSYYLHYECGAWFYKSSLIKDMKEDYLNTLKMSYEVSQEDCLKVKFPVRVIRSLLNLLAPLF